MEILIYFLKSAACLALLMLFYKLLLEKENMHVFKRFYLLIAVVSSFLIPFITFTTYIEAPTTSLYISKTSAVDSAEVPGSSYWSIILWTIYGLGVVFFSAIFIKNFRALFLKIKNNPKLKNKSITTVLLAEDVAPHTFWNYIFLNKQKFEARSIPKEVFEHEQAHAKQRHSLDILFMEFLQIIFWFYPLFYIVKRSIKLNHEFLADRAVIKRGVKTSTYQETLLAFSSGAANSRFVHSINYSSIKKRFTVMKTHTTKNAVLIRSLLLLPLLVVLIYSCSTSEELEKTVGDPALKEQSREAATPEMIKEYNRIARQYKNQEGAVVVLSSSDFKKLKPIYDLMTAEQKAAAEPFPEMEVIEVVEDVEGEGFLAVSSEKATPAMIAEYNKLARYYNSKGVTRENVEDKEFKRLMYLFGRMNPDQRKTVESLPPPPPPAPVVPEVVEGYPTPPSTANVANPPPPPPSPVEAVKEWIEEGATFFYNGKAVSGKEALEAVQKNDGKNLSVQVVENDTGSTVRISDNKR